jgi:hypothetical protein
MAIWETKIKTASLPTLFCMSNISDTTVVVATMSPDVMMMTIIRRINLSIMSPE